MSDHVHLDIAAFERKLREDLAFVSASSKTEFHRLQCEGNEVVVQFVLMGARLHNEGVDPNSSFHARIALLSSLIQGLAGELVVSNEVAVTEDEAKFRILSTINDYVRVGADLLAVTEAPRAEVGHA